MATARRRSSDPLQAIPGVGPSIAEDLRALGIRDPTGLRGRDPERLYDRINRIRGVKQDRCLLYVFRCAAYFAGTSRHQPELLKWWNWSDAAQTRRVGAGPKSGGPANVRRR